MVAGPLDLVPADVRERRGILEADGPAGEDPEGRRAVLVARLEEELQPEADPEERPVLREPAPDRRDEPVALQARHRGGRRPDPRDDERVRATDGLRVAHDRDVRADGREGLLDADEVAGAVVDDGDERAHAHPRAPFVEATPSRRGSGSQAVRMA